MTASPPPEESDAFPGCLAFWTAMCVAWSTFVTIALVILICLVAPWVSLFQGGLDTHDSFHWAVSPGPVSLAVRGGLCAIAMLAIVFMPSGWVQRTRELVRPSSGEEGGQLDGNADAGPGSATHAEPMSDKPAGVEETQIDAKHGP